MSCVETEFARQKRVLRKVGGELMSGRPPNASPNSVKSIEVCHNTEVFSFIYLIETSPSRFLPSQSTEENGF